VIRVLLDARKARDFGIGRHVLGLLGALARRGEFELQAVVLPGDAELVPRGVQPLVSEAGHYSVGELVALRNLIRAAKPDLFHAPHYVVPLFPPKATVVTIHDLMHLNRPEHATPLKRVYARTMLRRVVRLASRIVAVSEATRRELVDFDPRADGKTTVVPNGVDDRFRPDIPAAERERVRRVHRVEGPFVLFLGNDKPHKNLEGLLDSFAALTKSSEEVRLVLAGGSPERAASRRERIAERELSGRVLDLGIVPDADVPALLAEARALVQPSFTEGFGLPVLEAQAVGTPVGCSDGGGLREAAGDAALFFDPTRPPAIAAALKELIRDEQLRARLREAGLKHSAAFTWDRVAERTSALYREVLAG
jgi:glycosyltransferase involved in cell wall biosynthesis